MNPTQPISSDPAPQSPSQPLVEFIRGHRQNAAYVLLALSVVFLGFTIWMAAKGFAKTEAKPEDKPEATNPLDPEADKPTAEIIDPKQRDYRVGALGTLVGFIITAGLGARLMLSPPRPTETEQRTDARVTLLMVGGFLGMALIIFGGLFFFRWSDSLSNWLDKGETKEMRWVVIPLLMVVAGAGLVFTAVQPARAEERNNTMLRRLVYGSNLGLTVLLLFVVLVIANVVFAMRVPNKLDTTSTGFYTLSEPTQNFLGQLDQTITAYAILPDSGDRVVDDIRRLLQSAEDAGHGRFKVKFISPQTNRVELEDLRARYTQLELNDTGVLLTVGEEQQASDGPPGRYVFIRRDEFLERDASPMAQSEPKFNGEAKLIREVMFLAENKQKPIAYFTQSNGELDINGSGERGASQMKAFLEKNYLDVRAHKFDLLNPKVPDDADILIVAAPQTTFAPNVAEAIKHYMSQPRGDKKGKLIVLAGMPEPQEAAKIPALGLESVLSDFNISIGNKYVMGIVQGQIPKVMMPCIFTDESRRDRHPIAQTLRKFQMTMVLPREVTAIGGATFPGAPPSGGNPAYKATKLLETLTDYAWLEEEWPVSTPQMIQSLSRDRIRKQVTESKTVGVVASETAPGGAARVAVYGSGLIASDSWARQVQGTVPVEFDLIGVTIDWLRDRPPVPTGITSKTYTTYTFPPKVDTTRLLWFPLGLAIVVVAGLGAGVWVIRRK
jgi:hypothetical protein